MNDHDKTDDNQITPVETLTEACLDFSESTEDRCFICNGPLTSRDSPVCDQCNAD